MSDENVKVILDDQIVFEGTSKDSYKGRVSLALKGVHRLKVFYNLSSEQKVQKIIEYYQKLNEEKSESDSEQKKRTSIFSSNSNSENMDSDVEVTWRRL